LVHRRDIRLKVIMNVEFISGILAGAAGSAHAERGLARTGSGRGALGATRAAEGVGQPIETGDRNGDGRQPWRVNSSAPADFDEPIQSPAPSADSATSGQRLDLIG
jgi:hypothetical protein